MTFAEKLKSIQTSRCHKNLAEKSVTTSCNVREAGAESAYQGI